MHMLDMDTHTHVPVAPLKLGCEWEYESSSGSMNHIIGLCAPLEEVRGGGRGGELQA